MRGINKCFLLGNLTRDPILKETTNGTSVCNFGLATGRQWKDKNGQAQEDVEFHNIVLWSGLAQTASKYLHKGSPVYIEGRITTRKYNKDGVDKYITEIVANEMVLMPDGNKHVSENASSETATPTHVASQKEDAPVIPPPQLSDSDIEEVFEV